MLRSVYRKYRDAPGMTVVIIEKLLCRGNQSIWQNIRRDESCVVNDGFRMLSCVMGSVVVIRE